MKDMAHDVRRFQAHLPLPDSRQPVARWQQRLELALFPIGLLVILFAVAIARP